MSNWNKRRRGHNVIIQFFHNRLRFAYQQTMSRRMAFYTDSGDVVLPNGENIPVKNVKFEG